MERYWEKENEIFYNVSIFKKLLHRAPILLLLGLFFIQVGYVLYISGGFPYMHDNNESYLSYNHARNLFSYSPTNYSFLTAQDTSILSFAEKNGKIIPTDIYLHNPNLPRYANYLLFWAHIQPFLYQYLIIIIAGCLVSLFLYKKSIETISNASLIPILALLLFESQEIFPHFFNAYRIWSFITFGYCLYATLSKKNVHLVASFFLLFQFEYAFALFTFLSMFIFNNISNRDNMKSNLYILSGIALSLLLFLTQLITYSSFTNLYAEFMDVYVRRLCITHETLTRFSVISSIPQVFHARFGNSIFYLLIYAAVRSLKSMLFLDFKSLPINLFIAISVAICLTSLIFPGYVYDAYISYRFPFLCFLLIAGIIVAWQDCTFIIHLLKIPSYTINLLAIVFSFFLYSNFLIPNALNYFKVEPPINPDYLHFMKTEGYKSFFFVDGPFASLPNGITMFQSSTVDLEKANIDEKVALIKEKLGAQRKIFYMCGPFYRGQGFCEGTKKYLPKTARIVYENNLYYIARLA